MKYESVQEKDFEFIKSSFINLYSLDLGKFADLSKEVRMFHSAPFLDEDVYPFFLELVSLNHIGELSFFGLPLKIGDPYLKLPFLPGSFDKFLKFMETSELQYTGGIGYDKDKRILFSSCADVEILELQIDPDISIPEIELSGNSELTIEQANRLIRDHLDFLSG